MNEVEILKIWETKQAHRCTILTTIDELLKYIKDNKLTDITLHEQYHPNEEIKCIFDRIASNNNLSLIYTDNEHPICIVNWESIEHNILINPTFFNQYKKQIQEEIKKIILEKLNNKPSSIHIPDFLIDDDLINRLCNNKELEDTNIYFYNITNQSLSEEQIKKIKRVHLEVKQNNIQISSRYLIKFNTKKALETSTSLYLDFNLTNEEIENFIYINDKCIIKLNKEYDNYDEIDYLNNLSRILQILSKHNKIYNINITINNRELLKQSNILNYPNINVSIYNDLHDYSKEEYLKEEEQLDKLIEPIKKSTLSPYEKYLAVYNIVKNFKPYKENKGKPEEARYLRYILNNKYIVCVGYAKLLTTLLDKVGIPSMNISVGVDTSYDEGFTKEEKTTKIAGHQRNIIKIDDDKYNIHGIFVADATWDNDLENDLYNNSTMTFNRKKEAKRLESLTTDDLLLDFNSIENFKEKINFYLRRKMKNTHFKKFQIKLIDAYEKIYQDIQQRLSILDYNKYKEFHTKYNDLIDSKILNKSSLKKIEEIFSDFLTEYAMYILPLTNQKINDTTLLQAIINTKKGLNQELTEEQIKIIQNTHQQRELNAFPYEYDPNNEIPNYLTSKKDSQLSFLFYFLYLEILILKSSILLVNLSSSLLTLSLSLLTSFIFLLISLNTL